MMNKELENWTNNVQIDKGLKALSDIKIIIERFYEKGYAGDWEILRIIEDIETMCIYSSSVEKVINRFINEIIRLIGEYYELVGRSEESYSVTNPRPDKKELLKKIENILEKAKIPRNYQVISRLK